MKIYNDVQFLSCALESLKDNVDGVVIADGAYKAYVAEYRRFVPDAQPWSTDGSVDVVKALRGLPDLTFLRVPEGGWLNQVVKMNAMIDAVPVGEWFIDVNADEMLVGKIQEGFEEIEGSGCIVGRVPLVNLGCDIDRLHQFWHPRVWKKERGLGLHFAGTHWQARDYAGRLIESDYPIWWTQQFVMAHFKPLKPWRRVEPHVSYMRKASNRAWLEPRREELSKEGEFQ